MSKFKASVLVKRDIEDQDCDRLLEFLQNELPKAAGLPIIFNRSKWYAQCKFQKLSKAQFIEAMSDALSLTTLCEQVGLWLVSELEEGNIFYLTRVYAPDYSKYSLEQAVYQLHIAGRVYIPQDEDEDEAGRFTWAQVGLDS